MNNEFKKYKNTEINEVVTRIEDSMEFFEHRKFKNHKNLQDKPKSIRDHRRNATRVKGYF